MAQPSMTVSEAASLDLTGERTPVRTLLAEMRKRRKLVPMLASRDFRARYRNTSLGLLWAVLLPMIQGAILALVFTHIVRIRVTATSYPVFVIVGMTTWTYLTGSVQSATTSIVDQSDIAGRVYFPRLFLPGMTVLAGAPGLFVGLLVIIPLAAFLGASLSWHLVAIPLVVVLAVTTVYAVGAPLALLNVYFRDIKYFVIASLQALLYGSPIIYPLTRVHHLQNLLIANPATGVIELARWSFNANGTDPLLWPIVSTLSWLAGLTVITLLAYSKHERLACDRL